MRKLLLLSLLIPNLVMAETWVCFYNGADLIRGKYYENPQMTTQKFKRDGNSFLSTSDKNYKIWDEDNWHIWLLQEPYDRESYASPDSPKNLDVEMVVLKKYRAGNKLYSQPKIRKIRFNIDPNDRIYDGKCEVVK